MAMTNWHMTRFAVAVALLFAGSAQARPIKLTCRDTGNLYLRPYAVMIDPQSMTIKINRMAGPFAGRQSYPIVQIEPDSDGFSVMARGRALNSAIKILVAVDEKWIAYTDALTDRPFAIDYCR